MSQSHRLQEIEGKGGEIQNTVGVLKSSQSRRLQEMERKNGEIQSHVGYTARAKGQKSRD